MPQMKRKTVNLTPAQDAFVKRKKEELQRLVPQTEQDKITESGVIQGLINFWMTLEKGRKPGA